MRAVAALAAAIACLALVAPARAVERENALGADAGGALLMVHDKSSADVGGSVGLHYTYGLTDAFNLVANAGWSLVALNEVVGDPSTPRTRPTNVSNADVGVAYVLDVLQWVPWGAVELGGYALQGGTLPDLKVLPGAAVAIGLDYRLNRSWSIGVEVREHLLFTQTATYPSFLQGLARFEYVWGW